MLDLPPEAVEYFTGQARAWIHEQRDLHRPHAQPLPEATTAALARFFPEPVLAGVRWRAVRAIENPVFLGEAAALGVNLDFSGMEGITFDDTFLVTQAATDGPHYGSLVFHELVHAVQYRILGVDDFIGRYVEGFLGSGDYFAIPLELVAYALQARFMVNPDGAFSVEELVRNTVGLRRA